MRKEDEVSDNLSQDKLDYLLRQDYQYEKRQYWYHWTPRPKYGVRA